MSKFTDRREQEMVFDHLWHKGIESATNYCGDQGYVFYLGFSTLGSMLLKDHGPEKFMELVSDILEKGGYTNDK